jgi:hypothetical protein
VDLRIRRAGRGRCPHLSREPGQLAEKRLTRDAPAVRHPGQPPRRLHPQPPALEVRTNLA